MAFAPKPAQINNCTSCFTCTPNLPQPLPFQRYDVQGQTVANTSFSGIDAGLPSSACPWQRDNTDIGFRAWLGWIPGTMTTQPWAGDVNEVLRRHGLRRPTLCGC